MSDLMQCANNAVFVLQLNTADAVKYIVSHTGVRPKQAADAVRETTQWYKR